MTPSRRVRWSALRLTILLLLAAAAPSGAQTYGDYLPAFQRVPDPLARSPRLVGMGRMAFAVDDPHYQINLWDFAGNPTGVIDDDSVSTIQLRPAFNSVTEQHIQRDPESSFLRQDLAVNERRLAFELWRRHPGATTYGAIGEIGGLRLDRPYDASVEQRSHFSVPNAAFILNGPMPYIATDRMRYALRFSTSYVTWTERYRSFVTNAAGQFIDQEGELGDPPNFFTPDDITIQSFGSGAALSYNAGPPLLAAAGIDLVGNTVDGRNEGGRYASEQTEDRPFVVGQASLIGRVGTNFQWGLDGHTFNSNSDARWVFSISAGVGGTPLDGRGKLYHRKENGSNVRGRVRYTIGRFDLGAGGSAETRRIEVAAPNVDDPESFNHFRNVLVNTAGADSIVLPDSVVDNTTKLTGWEGGGGVAYHLPWRKSILAAEYHLSRSLFNQDLGGDGPKRQDWNVRVGMEVPMTEALNVRGGYIYRWRDRDAFIPQNEYVGNTITLGVGLKPSPRWSLEAGYAIDWFQADYGDPTVPEGSAQQVSVGIDWSF